MQQPNDPDPADRPRAGGMVTAAVYAAAALLLLAAVMLARGFARDVGDARVAGRFTLLPLLHSRVPEHLVITWNGLSLNFGSSMAPALRSFEPAGAGVDLVFDGGSRLRVAPGTDAGGSIFLTPVGAGATAASSVVIPFSVEGTMEGPPAGAGLAWRRAGRDFLLTLPGGARADTAAGTVTLSLAGGEGAVLQVEGVRPEARAAQAASGFSPLPAESSLPTEERLAASMNAWADAAYKGWSVSRWYAADSSWKLADGSQGFSEEIGAALLPESVARGTWQTVFPLWADTLALQRKTANPLVFSSAAYVGGERDFVRVRAAAVAAQLAQARDALARPDRSILAASDLVTLLVDHGTPDLVRGLGTFLGQMPGGLDVGSSLAYAQDLLDYQRLVRPDGSLDKLLAETVQRNILPSVRGVDGEVYLDLGAGRVDLRSSIWCGTLLLRAGAEMGSSQARAVGRGLLVSSLALADEAGFLPAGLALSGGRIASRVGRLAPETVYGLLPLDRPLAREKPLPGMGNGAWAWTSAKVVSATAGAPGATLVFAYPRGVPYHLVLAGLRPFSLLKLHGIAWHSDPAYDKYSDGWSYDADSRTLFMKITGRIDQEVVDITY